MFLANLTFGLFVFVGFLMMGIILLQRGRGGGLAGAFGGAGGSSAFGTRAGDVFTKITVIIAVLWVALACASIFAFRATQTSRFDNPDDPGTKAGISETDDKTKDKDDGKAKTPPAKDDENEKKDSTEDQGTKKDDAEKTSTDDGKKDTSKESDTDKDKKDVKKASGPVLPTPKTGVPKKPATDNK